MEKKIIYIDLDNTLADYFGGAVALGYGDNPSKAKKVKGFFENLEPIEGAIESFNKLSDYFDVYILSTSPWGNPDALGEKVRWVKKYLPRAYKKVIFSHHKNLNIGDYLIDDKENHGAKEFKGMLIPFGQGYFNNWENVIAYIMEMEKFYINNIKNNENK